MSATKALLLTDVVDSTRLAETLGDSAMAEVWAAHDRVARDCCAWRGREIDKTDGMLLLFDECGRRRRLRAGVPPRTGRAADAADGARRPARRAGDPARERRRGHRARRQAARGRRPGQADRGARDGAGAGRTDAARPPRPRSARQDARTGWCRTAIGIKGVTDPIELFEVGEPDAPVRAAARRREGAIAWCGMGDWWLPVNEIPNNLPHQVDVVHRPRARAGRGQGACSARRVC